MGHHGILVYISQAIVLYALSPGLKQRSHVSNFNLAEAQTRKAEKERKAASTSGRGRGRARARGRGRATTNQPATGIGNVK